MTTLSHHIDAEHIARALSEFSQAELQAMNRYCLKYRDLVHSDGAPTPEQDEKFMLFQSVCYAEGTAHGC